MRRSIAVFSIAALCLTACGTTSIVTTDPQARIVVDGETVGRGQGQIRQRGLPFSAQILVKTDDGREQRARAARSFTVVTFLLGFISYGVCWVACWEYPNVVFVDLPKRTGGYEPSPSASAAGAATPGVDPWLAPPPGWQPTKAPAKTEQPKTGDSDAAQSKLPAPAPAAAPVSPTQAPH